MMIPKTPSWLLTLGAGCTLAALPLSLASAQESPSSPTVQPASGGSSPAAATDTTATAAAPKEKSGSAWTVKETNFVKKAGAGNAAEVKVAQLALTNADSQDVKDFATQMVKDHGDANTDLQVIAQAHDIAFPPAETEHAKTTYDKLSKLKGAEFDKAYVAAMVADHTKDAGEYKMASESVKDDQLKGYVEKVKPIVESHLKMAKDIKSKMGSEKKA